MALDSVGLISDTHGLLRPKALEALRGCDAIIHAGDVGDIAIVRALERIAPVVAVKGNIDITGTAAELPATAVLETGAARIYVLHDLHDIPLNPAAAGFQAVVSGHSHRPVSEWRSGVLYVNPGSAGRRRFRLPVTVARLDLRATPWSVQFVDLSPER